MDDSLRLIQYLYGEEIDDPEFPRRVADDDALRQELAELQETKGALDRRRSASPDPDVVDRVVDRASRAARPRPGDDRAPDREVRTPERQWTRRLQSASAAVALLLVLGLGWWYLPKGTGTETAVSESAAQQSSATTASSESSTDGERLPEWDDRDEVVRLYRRIELLQTQSRSDAWDGDLQPASRTNP